MIFSPSIVDSVGVKIVDQTSVSLGSDFVGASQSADAPNFIVCVRFAKRISFSSIRLLQLVSLLHASGRKNLEHQQRQKAKSFTSKPS